MLSELYIENIALIEKLRLELGDRLNILSGETGAGKSIIIDSLNFALGERADRSLIRYGADHATVQATFSDYLTDEIRDYLDDMGIECEDILILMRKMTAEGRNECRINGRLVTLGILKGLTELLVDIHGQHEHQSLLKTSNHIHLLDGMGGSALDELKAEVASLKEEYRALKKEYERFGDAAERERRLDILRYQIDEIEKAAVNEGEEESLLASRRRIRNIEKIITAISSAKNFLDGVDGGACAALKSAAGSLTQVSDYDDSLAELIDRLESAKVEAEDIADTLSSILNRTDYDSRSADKIEERLEIVRAVTRKYGGSYEALSDFYASAKSEADALENAGERVEKLENEIKTVGEKLVAAAKKLTSERVKAANMFEKAMIRELNDLGMSGSTFKTSIVSVESADEIGVDGADTVEFLISPNVGEPLKPLAKIISGGEMSRFMLALKNIVASLDGIGTMVFDEIDTGISGHIAQVVSEKLCNISRTRQVIAVTHTASLAAMADRHYLISKATEGGKTLTSVTLLSDDLDEVARLIGGNDYSKYAVPHAREMKAWAEKYKKELKK